jgi:hypothetical protein
MPLVKLIMIPKLRLLGLVLTAVPFLSYSQENSPYSRYGIGNLVPTQNILNRAMGGVSAAHIDAQAVNFSNPATYGSLLRTTFDIGGEVDSRTIINNSPLNKFTARNAIMSYINIGIPLIPLQKQISKNAGWGINIGLRPISKINYKIQNNRRLTGIDSIATIAEGSGGLNEAFIGTGARIGKFSFGVNGGYLFGNKEFSTRVVMINDSVEYNASNSANNTHMGGLFLSGGVHVSLPINKDSSKFLQIGAYGKLKHTVSASRDIIRETFRYDPFSGDPVKVDSVFISEGEKGKLTMPATFGVGFMIRGKNLQYGFDFETTKWRDYRFYKARDSVKNTWMLKGGLQFYPATTSSKRYWNFVQYRLGFYVGPDYIKVGRELPQYGITVGGGFPLRLRRSIFDQQESNLNIALEYGKRGNADNRVRENIFRIAVGFSLSDLWFRRYKYD